LAYPSFAGKAVTPKDRRSMRRHREAHNSHKAGWLRAAVLGANDGTISVASLVVGVASAGSDRQTLLITAMAGLVAGAASMAAGEFVSVQSQADAEKADLAMEAAEIANDPDGELEELTQIYCARGLDLALARTVAEQLSQKGALEAHARDELGISESLRARPLQAAFASALAFAIGALVPLLSILLAPNQKVVPITVLLSLGSLFAFGAMAAKAGGAPLKTGALRMVLWGAIAMGLTSALGHIFGAKI
jgi:VIT1/CCC1 family predicted Fe2+/Mn2+ transporter